MPADTNAPLPPVTQTVDGNRRRIGIELEFSGLKMPIIQRLMQDALGGSLQVISDFEAELRDTSYGTFRVELDMAFAKKLGRQIEDAPDEAGRLEQLSADLIADIAPRITPHEIVTPPLPMPGINILDELIPALREAGAKGTFDSPIYAYGLHLNPELPDLKAETLTAYVQAYALLQDWLAQRCKIDWSRRITPFIDPWPREYRRLVCAADYAPSAEQLIDDYLQYNPTRNRGLDMLPALSEIDADRVQAVVQDDRVNARPALHYRLPNCRVNEEGWTLSEAWCDWLQVEHLASDDGRRAEMCEAWLALDEQPVRRLFKNWADRVEADWLVDVEAA